MAEKPSEYLRIFNPVSVVVLFQAKNKLRSFKHFKQTPWLLARERIIPTEDLHRSKNLVQSFAYRVVLPCQRGGTPTVFQHTSYLLQF
jgi:hypothetical protein